MKLKYILIVLLFLSYIYQSNANDNSIYLNPGVKLGYQFGANGGFIYGFEVSMTTYGPKGGLIGVVTNIDFCKGKTKLHFGLQASTLIGLEIGPTLYFDDTKMYYGITSALFGYIFVMPYYELSYIFEKNIALNQLGIFGKVPIHISEGRSTLNIW